MAVAFVDLTGFTRLTERVGDAAAAERAAPIVAQASLRTTPVTTPQTSAPSSSWMATAG